MLFFYKLGENKTLFLKRNFKILSLMSAVVLAFLLSLTGDDEFKKNLTLFSFFRELPTRKHTWTRVSLSAAAGSDEG